MVAFLLSAEAAVFGSMVGSIASSAAYRAPRGLSMFTTRRSRCDSCGATVRGVDLVPIVSWLALGGRCRHCARCVSATYPRTEICCATAGGFVTALVFARSASPPALVLAAGALLWFAVTRVARRAHDKPAARSTDGPHTMVTNAPPASDGPNGTTTDDDRWRQVAPAAVTSPPTQPAMSDIDASSRAVRGIPTQPLHAPTSQARRTSPRPKRP